MNVFSLAFSDACFFFALAHSFFFSVDDGTKKTEGQNRIFEEKFYTVSSPFLSMLHLALCQERKAWRPGEVFRATLAVRIFKVFEKKTMMASHFFSMPDHYVFVFWFRVASFVTFFLLFSRAEGRDLSFARAIRQNRLT